MLALTDQEILQDIANFQRRIQTAQNKLDMLPEGHLPFKEHKKREQARKALQDEINHVERMCSYAKEALETYKA